MTLTSASALTSFFEKQSVQFNSQLGFGFCESRAEAVRQDLAIVFELDPEEQFILLSFHERDASLIEMAFEV
jgi:hypothetical protein